MQEMGQNYLQQISQLTEIVTRLADELEAATKTDCELRRLCTVLGIGPVTAGAIVAFAPDLETFDNGRNFAAWLGLVPRQHTTGGKTRLGAVSKMGRRTSCPRSSSTELLGRTGITACPAARPPSRCPLWQRRWASRASI